MPVKVPYHHQKNCYFCGPTSLKMVLEKFSVKKTENEIARIAGTTKEGGTSHQGMIDACKRLGFCCFVHENSNMKNVIAFIKAKVPVIVDWTDNKSRTGHYSVITEVEKEKVLFYDPWYGPKYAVDKKTFEEYWNDSLTRGNRWIMAILPDNTKVSQEIKINLNKKDIFIKAGRVYNS